MQHELYRASGLPVLQNRTFATAEQAQSSDSGDIVLVQDDQSGLIFNQVFDASKLSYDVDYQNEQAHSVQFRQHLNAVEAILSLHFKGQTLIEVGCGKGYFLEMLREQGYAITGIDPSYEGDSPDVIKAPFTRELGLAADAIVLRHVLEHLHDPVAFLAEMAAANQGGQIYIEV
ncbi:methyltransferase, partial [Pseudomonas sp. HMWF005]